MKLHSFAVVLDLILKKYYEYIEYSFEGKVDPIFGGEIESADKSKKS